MVQVIRKLLQVFLYLTGKAQGVRTFLKMYSRVEKSVKTVNHFQTVCSKNWHDQDMGPVSPKKKLGTAITEIQKQPMSKESLNASTCNKQVSEVLQVVAGKDINLKPRIYLIFFFFEQSTHQYNSLKENVAVFVSEKYYLYKVQTTQHEIINNVPIFTPSTLFWNRVTSHPFDYFHSVICPHFYFLIKLFPS